jgi:hypothetical protein
MQVGICAEVFRCVHFESGRKGVMHSKHRKPRLKYMRGEPQDTDRTIQVQYNRQTQESIIDVDVAEWEQAKMAKHGGIVAVCMHNGNVDLILSCMI